MLYSTIFVAASALVSFASAQDNSTDSDLPIPCCTLPVNTIDEDDRDIWCLANKNTCTELCGGVGRLASNGNDCDEETLEYSCECSNGTDLTNELSEYEQTVPGQMCLAWFTACNAAAPDDRDGQYACDQVKERECGQLTTEDATNAGNAGSSSASGSATSGSPSATSAGGSSNTDSADASETTGAETAEEGAGSTLSYGTPALVGGLLAIFGFAL